MDSITDDGIFAFCEELGIDPQDPVILVLSWSMEAAAMCEFTRAEFVRGFEKLNCQNMEDLKETLPFLRSKLNDPAEFTHIYSVRFMEIWCVSW
jgi:DCN1-like protein 1/2